MTRPAVVIVGPLGSGRTSVGAALADLLGVPLMETEDCVAADLAMPFDRAILSLDQPAVAAAVEAAAIRQLSDAGEPRVVTLLPSAAVDQILEELASIAVPVVALTAPIAELARRVGLNAPRSAGLGQPRAVFAQMVKRLEELYRPVVRAEFSTEGRAPHTVAIEIMDRFALQ